MCSQHLKQRSLRSFFVLGWINLTFGVGGNFGRLISNLSSKMRYQYKIVRTMPLFFSLIMILAKHSLMKWLRLQQGMISNLLILNDTIYSCLKNDISLVNISWTVFEIFSKNTRKPSTFLAVATHQNDDDVIKQNDDDFIKTFVNL